MITVVHNPPRAGGPSQVPHSPLTFLLFGLLAGYYIAYYAGVLVRSNKPQTQQQT